MSSLLCTKNIKNESFYVMLITESISEFFVTSTTDPRRSVYPHFSPTLRGHVFDTLGGRSCNLLGILSIVF